MKVLRKMWKVMFAGMFVLIIASCSALGGILNMDGPTIYLQSPQAGSAVEITNDRQNITISGTVEDDSEVKSLTVNLDNAGPIPASIFSGHWSVEIEIQAGLHHIEVKAKNVNGNENSEVFSFTVVLSTNASSSVASSTSSVASSTSSVASSSVVSSTSSVASSSSVSGTAQILGMLQIGTNNFDGRWAQVALDDDTNYQNGELQVSSFVIQTNNTSYSFNGLAIGTYYLRAIIHINSLTNEQPTNGDFISYLDFIVTISNDGAIVGYQDLTMKPIIFGSTIQLLNVWPTNTDVYVGPSNDFWLYGGITNYTGNPRVEVKVDGNFYAAIYPDTWGNWSTNVPSGWLSTTGSNTVELMPYDDNGAGQTMAFNVVVDSSIPTLSVTTPTYYSHYAQGSVINLTYAASDSDSGLQQIYLNLENGSPSQLYFLTSVYPNGAKTWSDSYTITNATLGTNIILIEVRDMVGNSNMVQVPFIVDAPPAITLTTYSSNNFSYVSPKWTYWIGGDVSNYVDSANFTVEQNGSYYSNFSVTSGTWWSASIASNYLVYGQTNEVKVTVTDGSNFSNPLLFYYYVDDDSPTVQITAPSAGQNFTDTDPITLTFTATDLTSFVTSANIYVNSNWITNITSSNTSFSNPVQVDLGIQPIGNYLIEVEAYDSPGNTVRKGVNVSVN